MSFRYYREWELGKPSSTRGHIWRLSRRTSTPGGLFDICLSIHASYVV